MTGHLESKEIQCESCGATLAIQGSCIATRCSFCDNPSVLVRTGSTHGASPAFALGFSVDRTSAAHAVVSWLRTQRMAPLGLKRAVIEKITGVYIPVYLYSATARSNYQASIEESYQKTSLKVESDTRVSLGSRNRSEFYELAGPHVMYVSDILISASHAVSNQELQAIEPFDLSQLRRYSPALISGWDAEFPSRTKEEGMHVARTETESLISHTLRDFMPGDGVRNLRHNTDFQQESLTPTLVPVWVCAIRYSPHKPPLKILVNGQSGTVGGVVSRSWLKRLVWLSAGIAIVTALGIAIWKITQMVL